MNLDRLFVILLLFCFMYIFICRQVDNYFKVDDPLLQTLKEQLSVLDPRFRDVRISEGDKSYTINKERVYICLKDKNGRYYNRNMLVYVICHEYSHILCDEIDHTDKFMSIFDELLNKATRLGLYNPNIPILSDYCGHS